MTKKKKSWHPASTHSGKSKCQWANHENVQRFKRFMAGRSENCPSESLLFISMKTRLQPISRKSCLKYDNQSSTCSICCQFHARFPSAYFYFFGHDRVGKKSLYSWVFLLRPCAACRFIPEPFQCHNLNGTIFLETMTNFHCTNWISFLLQTE